MKFLSLLTIVLSVLSYTTAQSCKYDGVDFTQLPNRDLWSLDSSYSEIYYLRPCGTVSNLWCQLQPNTVNAMSCQVNPGSTSTTFSLGSNDTSAMVWSGSKSSGTITLTLKNGDYCGPSQADRISNMNFVCGDATTPDFEVTESPQCTYNFKIPTKLMC